MSNETQWTPGPWHEGAGNGYGSIFGPEGTRRDSGGLTPIAMINGTLHEDEANARLIAAAPEMAALLERLAANCAADRYVERLTCARDARALLAKIKGGSNA